MWIWWEHPLYSNSPAVCTVLHCAQSSAHVTWHCTHMDVNCNLTSWQGGNSSCIVTACIVLSVMEFVSLSPKTMTHSGCKQLKKGVYFVAAHPSHTCAQTHGTKRLSPVPLRHITLLVCVRHGGGDSAQLGNVHPINIYSKHILLSYCICTVQSVDAWCNRERINLVYLSDQDELMLQEYYVNISIKSEYFHSVKMIPVWNVIAVYMFNP